MNEDLSFYKVWRKLCRKIINADFEVKRKKENELLHEMCHENKNMINMMMAFYYKNNMRKFIKKQKDLC